MLSAMIQSLSRFDSQNSEFFSKQLHIDSLSFSLLNLGYVISGIIIPIRRILGELGSWGTLFEGM